MATRHHVHVEKEQHVPRRRACRQRPGAPGGKPFGILTQHPTRKGDVKLRHVERWRRRIVCNDDLDEFCRVGLQRNRRKYAPQRLVGRSSRNAHGDAAMWRPHCLRWRTQKTPLIPRYLVARDRGGSVSHRHHRRRDRDRHAHRMPGRGSTHRRRSKCDRCCSDATGTRNHASGRQLRPNAGPPR